jgi:hypothetical protein
MNFFDGEPPAENTCMLADVSKQLLPSQQSQQGSPSAPSDANGGQLYHGGDFPSDMFTKLLLRLKQSDRGDLDSQSAASPAHGMQLPPGQSLQATSDANVDSGCQCSGFSRTSSSEADAVVCGVVVPEVEAVRGLIAAGRCQDATDMISTIQGRIGGTLVDLLRGEVFLAQSRISEASACFLAILGEDPMNERALKAITEIHRRNEDIDSCYLVRALGACEWGRS